MWEHSCIAFLRLSEKIAPFPAYIKVPASDGSLFVYNILSGLHGSLPIGKGAIFRYNVTSIYGKILGECEQIICSANVPLALLGNLERVERING